MDNSNQNGHAPAAERDAQKPKLNIKSKLLWSLAFLVIAALSVYTVMSHSSSFSALRFLHTVEHARIPWLVAAACAVVGTVFLEASAILNICRSFGYRRSLKDGFFYAAGNVYFSAITPSATGGQPACAYMMIGDGIPGTFASVALIANLAMYTLSIVTIGVFNFIFFPGLYAKFGSLSRICIIVGIALQIFLVLLFYMLLRWDSLLYRLGSFGLKLLDKMHLIRAREQKEQKLKKTIDDYAQYSKLLRGRHKMLLQTFIINLVQRALYISVTSLSFLAIGGPGRLGGDIWVMQGFVTLGATFIPIPGAMGITDYLMIDGYSSLMNTQTATDLDLVSRAMSFYAFITLCGLALLWRYVRRRRALAKKK